MPFPISVDLPREYDIDHLKQKDIKQIIREINGRGRVTAGQLLIFPREYPLFCFPVIFKLVVIFDQARRNRYCIHAKTISK